MGQPHCNNDERDQAIDRALNILSKQFSDVQLFCSFVNGEGETEAVAKGFGNWYARVGLAREFLITDKANTEALAFRQNEDD